MALFPDQGFDRRWVDESDTAYTSRLGRHSQLRVRWHRLDGTHTVTLSLCGYERDSAGELVDWTHAEACRAPSFADALAGAVGKMRSRCPASGPLLDELEENPL
jgi:hypothetical protein